MASQPVIDYLQCLGVTTVLLLTVRHSTTENTLACCLAGLGEPARRPFPVTERVQTASDRLLEKAWT
jgi:hypothetical protein